LRGGAGGGGATKPGRVPEVRNGEGTRHRWQPACGRPRLPAHAALGHAAEGAIPWP
uniref:Uncharacterized protein n=1 Tax=Mustela putorius furo TaxID=9669 RepID=M3Y2Q9_MUSPF